MKLKQQCFPAHFKYQVLNNNYIFFKLHQFSNTKRLIYSLNLIKQTLLIKSNELHFELYTDFYIKKFRNCLLSQSRFILDDFNALIYTPYPHSISTRQQKEAENTCLVAKLLYER